MKKTIVTLTLLSFLAINAHAQGFDEDWETFLQLPQMEYMGQKGQLPLKVDLKRFAPPAGNQGKLNSCTGWAFGYAAATIQFAQKYGWKKEMLRDSALSPMFLYTKAADKCDGTGCKPFSVASILCKDGICKLKTFNPADCSVSPDDKNHQEAQRFRINGVYGVFMRRDSSEKSLIYNNEKYSKIELIKRHLSEGYAVVIGIDIPYSEKSGLSPADSWKNMNAYAEGRVKRPMTTLNHAICIVGYDDEKQTFEIMNSWGEQWGTMGFDKLKYPTVDLFARYGYALEVGASNKKFIEGSFKMEQVVDVKDDGTPVWEGVLALKNPSETAYTISDWDVCNQYRLVVERISKEAFVYVFSLDSTDKLDLHYPYMLDGKEFRLDDKTTMTAAEAQAIKLRYPKILSQNNDYLTIPPTYNPEEVEVLNTMYLGKDYVGVLYSAKPIENITARLYNFKKAKGTFHQRFKTAFGDILIEQKACEYDTGNNNRMNVSAVLDEAKFHQNYVLPLIMEIETTHKNDCGDE